MRKNNKGFTLVEMIVVVSIFAILLGIFVPSMNSVIRFRGKKTAESITAALDKTRVEAMSRLVGEVKLFQDSEGNYCVSYYLSKGKNSGIVEEDTEIIAKKNSRINLSYRLEGENTPVNIDVNNSLILTYDRETGSFRKAQTAVVPESSMETYWDADNYSDLSFPDGEKFCAEIIVNRGDTPYRTIQLITETGKYELV